MAMHSHCIGNETSPIDEAMNLRCQMNDPSISLVIYSPLLFNLVIFTMNSAKGNLIKHKSIFFKS